MFSENKVFQSISTKSHEPICYVIYDRELGKYMECYFSHSFIPGNPIESSPTAKPCTLSYYFTFAHSIMHNLKRVINNQLISYTI